MIAVTRRYPSSQFLMPGSITPNPRGRVTRALALTSLRSRRTFLDSLPTLALFHDGNTSSATADIHYTGVIKVSQKSTYILNLEDCIEVLNSIKEDLRPALAKIREDGRSLDNLLKDVKDKRSKFNELKSKTYSFSIPENGNDCYQVLQDTLNYYELYITSLEHSIVVEKTSTEKDKDDNIDINYENSFEKYEDFTDSLKDLKSELDNFNNK